MGVRARFVSRGAIPDVEMETGNGSQLSYCRDEDQVIQKLTPKFPSIARMAARLGPSRKNSG